MSKEMTQKNSSDTKYLNEIYENLSNPIHRRIIKAYKESSNPVQSMEIELGKILTEILSRED
jgi:flagellar motor switch protein FliM